MHLIFNTETTADIKTTMSLNEEKFEKCVTDIMSIVRNGDICNGDLSNENNEAGDSIKDEKHKLMLETHKVEIITADGELVQIENVVENSHDDIEIPKNKDLDQADEIKDVNNKETDKNKKSVALVTNDEDNEFSTKTINSEEEEDTLLILSDSDLNICDSGDKGIMDACENGVENYFSENPNSENACESVVVKEKLSENADGELTENDDNRNFDKSFSENSEKVHTELAIFDRETEICDKTQSADSTQCFVVEEQNETVIDKNATELCNDNGTEDASLELSDEMIDTEPIDNKLETEFNNLDDPMEDNIIITMDQNDTDDDTIENNLIDNDGTPHARECEDETIEKQLTAGSNEKLSNDEQVITGVDRIVDCPEDKIKTNSTETNEKQVLNQIKNTEHYIGHVSECGDETVEKKHTAGSKEKITNDEQMKNTEHYIAHVSECGDETVEKEHTAGSKEKMSNDEQMMTDGDGITDCPEDEIKTKTLEETDEKQYENKIKNTENESDHSDHKVTEKMDISEENMSLDLKDVADNIESGDESQCLTKITDPVENKTHLDGDCVIDNQENSMDVDDENANISEKVETEINLSTSPVKSPSNFNASADRTVTVDCSIKEPATTQNENTLALVPDISDDIIFNVEDDDKEKSTKLSDVKEVESTEIIVDNDKKKCDIDSDKKAENVVTLETKAPKSSEDIINLEETVSTCVKSDSKTPVQESEKLHKSTTEKISEVLNLPVHFDNIIDLKETATTPISSETKTCNQNSNERKDNSTKKNSGVVSPVLKLSNTLDILSDEEDGPKETNVNNKCINIEDDDDIMLIDDDTSGNESKTDEVKDKENEHKKQIEIQPQSPVESMEIIKEVKEVELKYVPEKERDCTEKENVASVQTPEIKEKVEPKTDSEIKKPLLQEKFLKTCKKNLADMTREELEEFCVLKIVESILDRSNLSEIRTKLKTMAQNIDEYKKKAMVLEKQSRDLQLVLKSVQDEQEKGTESIVPLKITRSVGMQVTLGLGEKPMARRKTTGPPPANKPRAAVPQGPRPQKPPTPQKQSTPQIPVPRLVPANNPTLKSPTAQQTNPGKIASPVPNGIKTPSPVQKGEKRSHNRIQSVTVDLTDDEPPSKVMNRSVPVVPPVRLVPSQNLLAPPRQQVANSSPRKVYIPISGPQGQNVRPGQTIMLKSVPSQGTRQRCPPPQMVRMPQTLRMPRPQGIRHPAPLPDCVKQYQPPNWKALPPAPDLKLAKVENGIVISWKIEGYQEDSYEEIASYQLYAYQETSSPPSTALWKKIGDVKALPLPMACTLTQFMAGYKYYFAVRALDIRSRLGPFSLPGSILLLNKI